MRINDIIKTIEIKTETGVVFTIKDDLSWFEHLEKIKIEDDDERGVFAIEKMLVDWNLEDKEGNKLKINKENIKNLPINIASPLIDKVSEILIELSKKKTK